MRKIFCCFLFLSTGLFFSRELSAQTDPSNPQIICEGAIKTYQVDYTEGGGAGTPGSDYVWTITSPGFLGTITNNLGPSGSSNRISIDWGTTLPNTYVLEVIETNNSCPGLPITLNIQIIPKAIPDFDAIGPLCINTTAPLLPATDKNGIPGSWIPANINTTALGLSTYTFTPDVGQCAVPTTIDINIETGVSPTFDPIGPVCQNSTPPSLPLISNNGFTGTWSPTVITTTNLGDFTFTFTPDAGQCAVPSDITINIGTGIIPSFPTINPLCFNETAPILPLVDNGGITGTWIPSSISTTILGSSTYSFTPNTGQCASPTTVDIFVNDLPVISAGLDVEICIGLSTTLTASGGDTYTWSPNTNLSATTGTSVTASPSSTLTYNVIGTDANGCSNTDDIQVTVNPLPVTSPIFHD